MEQTLFKDYVEKYFEPLVLEYNDYINGELKDLHYYHLDFLTPRYSATGEWASITTYNQYVKADTIALDASIPVKRAPSLAQATGKLPKVATRRQLNETGLREIQLLEGLGGNQSAEIRRLIFEHVPQVIRGQYEAHEFMFLQALSTGIMTVNNENNNGTQFRVDFGYKAENKGFASVIWGQTGYKPLSDLDALAEKARAKGSPIRRWLLDRNTFNQIRNSDEAKALFNPLAPIVALNLEQLNMVALDTYGFIFEIIERVVEIEDKDGNRKTVTPWEAGQVIGISDERLGALVYSDVAEMSFPAAQVMYQRAGVNNYMLVKKYRVVEPSLAEVTASESLSLPVLSNVDRIFKFDSTAVA